MRKLHESIADPKYEGIKSSRKAVFDDEEHSGTEPGDSEDRSDKDSVSDESSDDDSSIEEQQDAPSTPPPEAADDGLVSTLTHTRETERKKGKAVVEQLACSFLAPSSYRVIEILITGNMGQFA